MSNQVQDIPYVQKLLTDRKMTTAVVIDDAFDPIYLGEISNISVQEFQQIVEQDSNFISELEDKGIELLDEDKIDDDTELCNYLNQLWNSRGEQDDDFYNMLRPLFQSKMEKFEDVESLCTNLEGLGITVQRVGSDVLQKADIFESQSFNFVFIDYYLGPENSESVNRAVSAVELVHQKSSGETKPITVLMSSNENVEKNKEDFRKNANLLEGIFRFSAKSQLKDEPIFVLSMGVLAKEYENRHQLQAYLEALFKSAKSALEDFESDIKRLKTEDYVFIQNLGLQNDQQPLGDYMAWLYGSYWGHLLLRDKELRVQQSKLDSLYRTNFPVFHEQPSDMLGAIYTAALFDELEDVGSHPMHEAVNVENEEEDILNIISPLYLHIGDVFTNDSDERVWMIINAQCDLERVPPSDRSILLIPGDLQPFDEVVEKSEGVRTDFFRYNERSFRIFWKFHEVQTRRFDGMQQWKADFGYKRRFRLKLPFALEIQRSFASNLTRIGLPVLPPLSEAVKIEVISSGADGELKTLLPNNDKYASRVMLRGESNSIESRIIFTFKFGCDLKTRLLNLAQETGLNTMAPDEKIRQPLHTLIKNFDKWFLDLQSPPLEMPKSHTPKDIKTKVRLAKGWAEGMSNEWNKCAILINVLEDTEPKTTVENKDE